MGRVKEDPSLAIGAGTTTITAADTAVVSASESCSEVLIQADPDNTVDAWIGDSSSQTIQMQPGDAITIPIDDVQKVYARATASATFNWFKRD